MALDAKIGCIADAAKPKKQPVASNRCHPRVMLCCMYASSMSSRYRTSTCSLVKIQGLTIYCCEVRRHQQYGPFPVQTDGVRLCGNYYDQGGQRQRMGCRRHNFLWDAHENYKPPVYRSFSVILYGTIVYGS